jgi:hypothetical protein
MPFRSPAPTRFFAAATEQEKLTEKLETEIFRAKGEVISISCAELRLGTSASLRWFDCLFRVYTSVLHFPAWLGHGQRHWQTLT